MGSRDIAGRVRGRPAAHSGRRFWRELQSHDRRELTEPATRCKLLPDLLHPQYRSGLQVAARWSKHSGDEKYLRWQFDGRLRTLPNQCVSRPGIYTDLLQQQFLQYFVIEPVLKTT